MAFPYSEILTSFTGADEDPLSEGGNWSGPVFSGGGALKRASNTCKPPATGAGSSYWAAASFGPAVEVYCTVTTVWVNDNSDTFLWLHLGSEGSASLRGYQLYIFQVAGAFTWQLYRYDTGSATLLGSNLGTQTISNGDAVGLACDSAGVFQAYYKASAGSWATLGSTRTDTTYTSGHIGLGKGFNDTTSVLDNFGGGRGLVYTQLERGLRGVCRGVQVGAR